MKSEMDAFPPLLRALLEEELAAGNEIAEMGHSFPAPPAGAYIRLKNPVSTRPRANGGGLKFRDFHNSLYSGAFTDERGFFFLLEPPGPPPPEPDMDAIRAANNAPSAVDVFQRSMSVDYEKWHDGIGYDLDVLKGANAGEKNAIEGLLLSRGVRDWRDVEALAQLDTPAAHKALRAAARHQDPQIRLAVVQHAPQLVSEAQRTKSLVQALASARLYGGLAQALDEAAQFHPPAVIEALKKGVLERDGETAVHFAALLTYIHGKASSAFDMEQRPFFLRFHTDDPEERRAAYRELCKRIGIR